MSLEVQLRNIGAPWLGVHRIQNFAIRLDPDPDTGSGSELDPNHLDPAGSGSKPDKRRKITLSAAQVEQNGMTVYPVL